MSSLIDILLILRLFLSQWAQGWRKVLEPKKTSYCLLLSGTFKKTTILEVFMDIVIQFVVEISYSYDVLLLLIYKANLKGSPKQNRLQGNLGVI